MSYFRDYAYCMRKGDFEKMFSFKGKEEGLRLFSLAFPYVITRNDVDYVVGCGKDVNFKPDDEDWQQFYELCDSCQHGVRLIYSGDFDSPEIKHFNETLSTFDWELYEMISLKVSFELPKV